MRRGLEDETHESTRRMQEINVRHDFFSGDPLRKHVETLEETLHLRVELDAGVSPRYARQSISADDFGDVLA